MNNHFTMGFEKAARYALVMKGTKAYLKSLPEKMLKTPQLGYIKDHVQDTLSFQKAPKIHIRKAGFPSV